MRPPALPEDASSPAAPFSHDAFDRVLRRFVDEDGRVDYPGLKEDPADLDRYYALVAAYSPDSHPDLFASRADRLAYWINAYNAVVLRTVVARYPIAGVEDVAAPFPFWLFSSKLGFFVFQYAAYGGETANLYSLENFVVRKRFGDPRVHFALNCASRGCPRLPRHAFRGPDLERQLDAEAHRFFAEERNLRIDHRQKTVHLSSILDWFEDDFLDWYEARHGSEKPTLVKYAALYAPPETAAALRRAAGYAVRFVPYDWRLNDRTE
jgi:hypothetical protein